MGGRPFRELKSRSRHLLFEKMKNKRKKKEKKKAKRERYIYIYIYKYDVARAHTSA